MRCCGWKGLSKQCFGTLPQQPQRTPFSGPGLLSLLLVKSNETEFRDTKNSQRAFTVPLGPIQDSTQQHSDIVLPCVEGEFFFLSNFIAVWIDLEGGSLSIQKKNPLPFCFHSCKVFFLQVSYWWTYTLIPISRGKLFRNAFNIPK